MMPKISVLMPVYNPNEEYLQSAIESILNQTFEDYELIIYDDSSNTGAKKIIEKYNDKRIKYIQGECRGIGYACNMLVSIAKTKYIARMDSDDIAYSTRLQEQFDFMESHPEVSILGTDIEMFPVKRIIHYKERPAFFDFINFCHIAHPTVMMRLDDLRKHNLNYDATLFAAEDYDLWSRAVNYLNIANLPKVLLKYRVHENSTTENHNFDLMKQNYIIKKRMLEFLSNDIRIQNRIKNLINPQCVFKKIFQIKNDFFEDGYYKVVILFGLTLKLYKKFNY